MKTKDMQILVVGAGIGGLCAALALRKTGAQVTVLERADAIREVGAGLQISPNGAIVLQALGLGEALEVASVRAQAVELRDYRAGALVSHLDLTRLGQNVGYHFLHRADLVGLLETGARRAGVKIILSQDVTEFTPGSQPKVRTATDDVYAADLVVGADGLHSKLRPVINGRAVPFFTGQCAWRATVPNTMNHPAQAHVHMGPGRHLVSYPLRGGAMVNLVAVQERAGWVEEGWHHEDDPANLRAAFADFGGTATSLLAAVDSVGLWGLFRHEVAPLWHKENTALLGDAAHPTLPFMAQGAVMAIEDAWVLADALKGAGTIGAGLKRYQARRHARVTKIIDTATGNAWKYHLRARPLRDAAHLVMRLGSALAPAKMMDQFDWIYRYDVTREQP